MQHIYTEWERLDGKYRHLVKLGKQREGRVLKPPLRINLDSFCLSITGNILPKLNLTHSIWKYLGKRRIFCVHCWTISSVLSWISKTLKKCIAVYSTACVVHMLLQWNEGEGKKQKPNKRQLLHGCNTFLAAYERYISTSRLYINSSGSHKTALLNGFFVNGLFISTGIKGMLNGKDYRAIDIGISFLAPLLDKSLGGSNRSVLLLIHTLYSDIVNLLLFDTFEFNANDQLIPPLQEWLTF